MSDTVWFFAYPEPTPPNARALLDGKIADLIGQGIIRRDRDPEAILGEARGPVHRPTHGAVRLAGDGAWCADLLTNGAEFCPSFIFNCGPLNTDILECSLCASVNDWASEGGFVTAGFGVGLWNWPYGTPLMDADRDSVECTVGRPGLASDGYRI